MDRFRCFLNRFRPSEGSFQADRWGRSSRSCFFLFVGLPVGFLCASLNAKPEAWEHRLSLYAQGSNSQCLPALLKRVFLYVSLCARLAFACPLVLYFLRFFASRTGHVSVRDEKYLKKSRVSSNVFAKRRSQECCLHRDMADVLCCF